MSKEEKLLDEVRRAAEMAAVCEVDRHRRAPEEKRFAAKLWCSSIGQTVVGYGRDTWEAVQAAHGICDAYKRATGAK